MRKALIIGAGVGALVALFWAMYARATFPSSMMAQPVIWLLAQVTCPIAFLSGHFHFPISLYLVVIVNAATYALLAALIETLRRKKLAQH